MVIILVDESGNPVQTRPSVVLSRNEGLEDDQKSDEIHLEPEVAQVLERLARESGLSPKGLMSHLIMQEDDSRQANSR
jgi:hypothetical protein